MPLSISKATPTEYAFLLSTVPLHGTDELRLNIFGTVIPGISLENTEFNWTGKHVQYHVGGITFEPLTINFIVDVDFKNWKVLYRWLTYIADNRETPSLQANDYVTDAAICIFDNFGTRHTIVNFKNVWVQSLGEITLSVREGETYIESNATFQYDRYEVIDTTQSN